MTLVGLLNSLIRIFGDPYLRFKVKQIIFRVPVATDGLRNTEGDNPRDDSMTERSMHQEETKSQLLIAAVEEESKRSAKGLSAGMGLGQEEMLAQIDKYKEMMR